jgi:hypothetical protein
MTESITTQKIKEVILKTIRRARRSGVWKRIGKIERGVLCLSSSLQITFKSMNLLRAIVTIMKEINQLTSFTHRNYTLGIKTAYRIAEYAAESGYQQATHWTEEKTFVIWWGIFLNPLTYTR